MLAIARGFLVIFSIGALMFAGIFIVMAALLRGGWSAATYETRFRRMMEKYGNSDLARMIAKREVWTGQTADQLRDAKGAPVNVVQSGSDEIWIFPPMGFTRQAMRVALRDGRVAGWE